MRRLFLGLLFTVCSFQGMASAVYDLYSPDRKIHVVVKETGNSIWYELSYNGSAIIKQSALGLETTTVSFHEGQIGKVDNSTFQETWRPLVGKFSQISNHYNQSVFHIQTDKGLKFNICFRVFDDGVAFRYNLPVQRKIDAIEVTKDLSEYNFSGDFSVRGIDQNIEGSEFEVKPLSQRKFSKLPLLVETPSAWVALNEASLFDFSEAYLVNPLGKTSMSIDIDKSACRLPMKTPWRVIQIGATAGKLIESNILVNLNDPCQIKDISWITPGKSMWDWRNHGDTINGFVYGINEASYKRLIDFAAANAMAYTLFDAAWYSENGPAFPRDDLDMPGIIKYANAKNVDVLLYVDRHGKGGKSNWNLEQVLQTYKSWGAKGIKYGFLAGEISNRKQFVDTTRSITKLCAKYHMLVTFHDNPIHPGGEERTWPNLIAKEYCHGQQDSRKSFGPYKAVSAPFINGLSGALDMTNGFYDLDGLQNRQKVDKKGLNSTVVGETARCFVNYSPLLVLPDNGDEYSKKADLFSFIQQMPNSWDETRVLLGVPGAYIVVARRSGNDWFIGGNTNEEGRSLQIPLSFLGKGDYQLTSFKDGEQAHYITNKLSYSIEKSRADNTMTFKAVMAPGGGFCLICRKIRR
jgi:Glycosyl-hydrolase 97 N-terminal/Glycoside hydrolase 97/Glycosyl-hydrolase 97 C-terminal, oligomerisation